MQPAFRVIADGQDVTQRIADRLVELTVSDEAGGTSDTLDIRLDDREHAIELPRRGAELEVAIGMGEAKTMGRYVVDEVTLEGPPATLSIAAKAADMRQSLKSQKTRSWDETTLGDVVSAIAGEHGLEAKVATELAAVSLTHVDQTEESDLHLVTRLAQRHGATAKPAGGALLVVPRGSSQTASGRTLPAMTIQGSELSRWSVTIADRERYASVVATYHDPAKAEPVEVTVGSGEPAYRLRDPYPDEAAAQEAADARLRSAKLGEATLRATLAVGRPEAVAETPITVEGVREGVDGEWVAKRVRHRFGRSGYTTEIESEVPA